MAPNTRRLSPGESLLPRQGLQNEQQFLNRSHLGQVDSVDSDNGTLDVVILDLGDRVTVEIPLGAISINQSSSAWDRHMPQRGDFVEIAFDQRNQPRCIGFAMLGDNASAIQNVDDVNTGKYTPHLGGYKAIRLLKEASDKGQKGTRTNPDGSTSEVTIGLRDFIALKPGEFDKRSSGGAYIHGSRFGQLTLSAAADYVVIDKQRDEISGRTGLYKWTHCGALPTLLDGTQVRLGDVKRALTSLDVNDSPVVGAGREWHLHVDQPIAVASNPPLVGVVFDEIIGDVRNNEGLPIPAATAWTQTLTKVGVPLYSFSVDAVGLVSIDHGTSVSVSVAGSAATYQSSFLNQSLAASALMDIGGATTTITGSAALQIDAPAIQIGGLPTAIHPAVHGDILIALLGAIGAAVGTIPSGGSSAASAITAAITAATAVPGPTNLVSAKILIE